MKLNSTSAGAVDSGYRRASFDSIPPLSTTQPPPSGALALVPMGQSVVPKTLVQGFCAVAQKQGPVAAIQWLVKNSVALQAVVKTPVGRGALIAATLGATVGWTVGANAQKAQAVATALQAVADQNLPPDQTAQQVAQVLQAALSNGERVKPAKGTASTDWPRSTRPPPLDQLRTQLRRAEQSLGESQAILRENPSKNPGQEDIVKARSAVVAQPQAKVNALERAQPQAAGSQANRRRDEVPVVARLPNVSKRNHPVVPVSKLPVVAKSKTADLPNITQPQSPVVPKEIDPSAAAKKRFLDRAGDPIRRQREEQYRRGESREKVLDRLTGNLRKVVEADINRIDHSKLPPGGATGGHKGGHEGDFSNSASTGGSKPTHTSLQPNASVPQQPGPSWPLPGPVKPKAQENFDIWFGRGKPTSQKGLYRSDAQRHRKTDGPALSPQLKELLALEGPQPYANASLQGPPSEYVLDGTKPRVVYHGTHKTFHEFKHSQTHDSGWLGTGYYFTSDPKLASTYALARSRSPQIPAVERGNPVVLDVYLSLRKPYVVSNDQFYSGKLQKSGYLSEELTQLLKNQGFDGVIFEGPGRTEYCIFNSPQIKSVPNNRGTYNPKNPDMRSESQIKSSKYS